MAEIPGGLTIPWIDLGVIARNPSIDSSSSASIKTLGTSRSRYRRSSSRWDSLSAFANPDFGEQVPAALLTRPTSLEILITCAIRDNRSQCNTLNGTDA